MQKTLKLISVCAVVLFTVFSGAVYGAMIHGKVYDWSTFAKLDNAVVEINTTPKQKLIAANGEYSFNVSKGSYRIEARYYKDNILEYFAEEDIAVGEEGDFVLDIIMFPAPFEEALFEYNESEISVDEALFKELGDEKRTIFSTSIILAAAVVVFVAILIAFYAKKRKEKEKQKPEAAKGEEKKIVEDMHEPRIAQELPGDLSEVVEMIVQEGGRTTQQELREKMQCSEAKLSLMLADLEDRGIIKKIKKGRGNIIILQKQEEKNE